MIRVELVDAGTGQVIARAELPVEQLPESFEADTTLHLGGDDWSVESAEPMTRAEYVASGKLRVVMRKLERVDPKAILFSLPTIENTLPPIGAGEGDALPLHEDDWRQLELVSSALEPEIAAELADIRAALTTRKGAGYEKLHVRSRIAKPLAGREIQLAALATALGDPARGQVAIGGGLVVGGFAYPVDDGVVYGHEDGGLVQVLALLGEPDPKLVAFAKLHDLVLVTWCRAELT